MIDHDHSWMGRALELARRAVGRVAPNPAVGAVLVRDGRVAGEGWTQPPGGPHAEVMALRDAGCLAHGATLYVTLEPCAHVGRTPPCVDALLRAGISRAVVAVPDPYHEVDGRGIRLLRESGIPVIMGVRADEVLALNAGYFKRILTGLPEVTAKFAMSLDGRIATRTGHARWITSPEARQAAHVLRDAHDAILIGVGTMLADDPLLTTRLPPALTCDGRPHHPLRVILDSTARTPTSAAMLGSDLPGETLIATTECANPAAVDALRGAGAAVVVLPSRAGRVDLEALLRHLAGRGVNTVLVEGGGQVHGALFDAGLIDRVEAFVAPVIIGGATAPSPVAGLGAATIPEALRLAGVDVRQVGPDVLVSGRVSRLPSLEDLTCSVASSKRSDMWRHSIQVEATTL